MGRRRRLVTATKFFVIHLIYSNNLKRYVHFNVFSQCKVWPLALFKELTDLVVPGHSRPPGDPLG